VHTIAFQSGEPSTWILAQADAVGQFVSDIYAIDADARVIVLGNFNDLPSSAALAVLADATLALASDLALLPVLEQYTVIRSGNAAAFITSCSRPS
jgi:hypothetical protein